MYLHDINEGCQGAKINPYNSKCDKHFLSFAPGYWKNKETERWNEYRWQLQNRVRTLEQLEEHLILTKEERAGVLLTGKKLSMGITPHYFNLINPDDPNDPIRRQIIPRLEETLINPQEMKDPCGEDSHMPVPGLVHRYPDRVLFLVTDQCAAYCRYCTRSRVVSGVGEQQLELQFKNAYEYLKKHTEVRDVLLSGGDPLWLNTTKLEKILTELRNIPHIEFIRIGSRIPIFMPQRIDDKLCNMLKKFHPLWLSVHANHPRELTIEVKGALAKLADSGIPIGNQSVLLKGVNDDEKVMKDLCQKLLMCRVKPYYLYQCDLINGSAHLRVPIRRGIEIIKSLRGFTSGYAVPQYVIDAPGGGGKVPINPEYILEMNDEFVKIKNYEGKVYTYPEK